MNDSIITDFLTAMRNITKLQNRQYKMIGSGYGLTAIDVSILFFLNNNPTKDSASDIVELRKISKGNVSMSIDALIKNGFLEALPDVADKRRKHLKLLDKSYPVIEETFQMYKSFSDIFQFDDETFREIANKIITAGEKAGKILGEIQ